MEQPEKVELKVDKTKDTKPTESQLLAQALYKKIPHLVSDYRQLIKHTGGMVTASMGYAYQKGLNDALKTLMKEMNKNVSKED